MSVSEPEVFPFGPGVLTIGLTGTEIDVSCLVNNCVITPSKNETDPTTKLCGDIKRGAVTYDWSMAGNMDTDIGDAAGFFALTHEHAGEELDYTYTPNSDAGTTASGVLVVDPLEFGGTDAGETMTSDFEFTVTAAPEFAYGGVVAAAAPASRRATAETDTAA
jgi:hypothetical protein